MTTVYYPARSKERPLLAELRGQTITVTGTFVRLGCFGKPVITRALFENVREARTHHLLAYHFWADVKDLRLTILAPGDRVTMTGKVRRYKRAAGSVSYKLEHVVIQAVNGRAA